MHLSDYDFNHELGDYYLLMCKTPVGDQCYTYTRGTRPIFTTNFNDPTIYKNREDAHQARKDLGHLTPGPVEVKFVRDFLHVVVCIKEEKIAYPTLVVKKRWIDKKHTLSGNEFVDMDEARKFLQEGKIAYIKFYQDVLLEISRLTI